MGALRWRGGTQVQIQIQIQIQIQVSSIIGILSKCKDPGS